MTEAPPRRLKSRRKDVEEPAPADETKQQRCNNVQTLRDNGIGSLFHFTDESNLDSISKHGLLTWKKLGEQQIPAKMNSSDLSHRLDEKAGLADFVRLSFCKKHPMMYIALKNKRISKPVVLEIRLEVVSRPGVLFCAINAASTAAKASDDPTVIHFETVRARSQRSLRESERRYFQGEVLVPAWIPPHLIKIPKSDAFTEPLELHSSLVGCTLSCEIGGDNAPKPFSTTTKPFSTTKQLLTVLSVAAGGGTSTPKPLVSLRKVHSARIGKSNQETFAAPKALKTRRVFRWSNLQKTQEERKQKLASLVDPDHVLTWEQFGLGLDLSTKKRKEELETPTYGCEMPLSVRASCLECREVGGMMNCEQHMRGCGAPIWVCCGLNCARLLCLDHMSACYCASFKLGVGGVAARESAKARDRASIRERDERERQLEWC